MEDDKPIDSTQPKINGWLICKLKEKYDLKEESFHYSESSNKSMLGHIGQLAYGILSEEPHPPSKNWVFLANDPSLHSVAKFSQSEIEQANRTEISVDLFRVKDESYKSTQALTETYFKGYIVKNSPIQDLNGKYLEEGMFYGAPIYRHVRQWVILRCSLSEIEELGITREDAKLLNDRLASAEKFFEKAEKALIQIATSRESLLKDGSAEFTRLFIDIARAGNKLVTADQTICTLRQNDRRTEYISIASINLLRQIAGSSFEGSVSSPSTSPAAERGGQDNSLQRNSKELGYTASFNDITVDNVELQLVFGKQITYQKVQVEGAQGNKNAALKTSEHFDIESELAAEVLMAVEHREALLEKLRTYVKSLESIYLTEGFEAIEGEPVTLLEGIFQELRLATIEFSHTYGKWARYYVRKNTEKQRVSLRVWDAQSYHKNYCVIVGFYGVGDLFGASQPVTSNTKRFSRGYEPPKKITEMKYIGEYHTEAEAFTAFHEAMRQIPQEQIHPDDLASNLRPIVSFRSCLKHYLVRTSVVDPMIPCEQCSINEQIQLYKHAAVLYEGSSFPCFLYKQYNYNQKIWRDYDFLSQYGVIRKLYSLQSIGDTALGNTTNTDSGGSRIASRSTTFRNEERNSVGMEATNDSEGDVQEAERRMADYRKEKEAEAIAVEQRNLVRAIDFRENPFLLPNITKQVLAKIPSSSSTASSFHNKVSETSFDPLSHLRTNQERLVDAVKASRQYFQELQQKQLAEKYKSSPYNVKQTAPLLSSLDNPRTSLSTKLPASSSSFLPRIGKTLDTGSSESTLPTSRILSSSSAPLMSRSQKPLTAAMSFYSSLGTTLLQPEILFEDDLSQIAMKEMKTAWKILIQTYQPAVATSSEPHPQSSLAASELPEHSTSQEPVSSRLHDTNLNASSSPLNARKKSKKDPDLSKTVSVLASYSDKSADLSLVQKRFAPAYREEGVFARTDVGEFAGLTKGRAVRAFDFKEQLYRSGKEREAIRRDMQQRLRRAVSVHIVDCDVPAILALIEEAKTIRGSVLQLDIIQAENFLHRFRQTCRFSLKLQSIYRGNVARKYFRQLKFRIKQRKLWLKQTEIEANAAAKRLVPQWIERGIRHQVKRRTRPFFSTLANLSGFSCMISIFDSARHFRKPLAAQDLCIFCQSKSFLDVHFAENPELSRHERMPCVCPVIQTTEHWLVRFYFPVISQSIWRRFSLPEVRSLLLDFHQAKFQFLNPQFLQETFLKPVTTETDWEDNEVTAAAESTATSLYEMLEPLFSPYLSSVASNPRSNSTDRENMACQVSSPKSPGRLRYSSPKKRAHRLKVKTSFSKAWFQAARESAVLPRLQRPLPPSVFQILRSSKGKSSTIHLQSTLPPQTLLDYPSVHSRDRNLVSRTSIAAKYHFEVDRILQSQWNWEPIYDLTQLELIGSDYKRGLEVMERRQSTSRDQYHRQLDVMEELRDERERAAMVLEDQWSQLYALQWQYDQLLRKNQEIMNFSRGLFDQISALEKRQRLDETRSYDELEDGFQWKEMNRVMKVKKRLTSEVGKIPPLQDVVKICDNRYFEAVELLSRCAESYDASKRSAERYRDLLDGIRAEQARQQSDLKRTMTLFSNLFSFRRKLIPSLGHHLVLYPYNLVFLRHPLLRLKKEYRKVMTGLIRRAMTLSASNEAMTRSVLSTDRVVMKEDEGETHDVSVIAGGSNLSQRFQVSVFLDELTGSIIINLTGGGKTEEGCQHEDLLLEASTFSSITQFIQPGDIVLTSSDITALLRRPPDYYQTYSQRFSFGLSGYREQKLLRLRSSSPLVLPSQVPRNLQCYSSLDYHRLRQQRQWEQQKPNHISKLIETLYQDKEEDERRKEGLISSSPSGATKRSCKRSYAGYYHFYRQQEEKKTLFAERLLEYLKIQPHSHRPCFGLLHFKRRCDFSHRNWKKSLWHSDVLAKHPLYLPSQAMSGIVSLSLSHQRWHCELNEHLDRFEIVLRSLVQDQIVPVVNRIEVHAQQILEALFDSRLVDTAFHPDASLRFFSFIHRLITGNYQNLSSNRFHIESTDLDLLQHVLRHLRRDQIGSLRNHLYRGDFPVMKVERPVFRFESRSDRLFCQSSHLRLHRFVCGKYCCVRVYESCGGEEYKIEFSKPLKPLYWNHQYRGPTFSIVLSIHMIQLLLMREQQLSLLKKEFEVPLLQFLLSRFEFISALSTANSELQTSDSTHSNIEIQDFFSAPPAISKTSSQGSDDCKLRSESLKADSTGEGECYESRRLERMRQFHHKSLQLNIESFQRTFSLDIDKYNSWVERRGLAAKHLHCSSSQQEKVVQQLQSLSKAPIWRFKTVAIRVKDRARSELVSSTPFSALIHASRNSLETNTSWKAIGEEEQQPLEVVHEERIPIYNSLWTFRACGDEGEGQGDDGHESNTSSSSEWFTGKVSIEMNEQMSNLYLSIEESTEEEKMHQSSNLILQQEKESMDQEDSRSQQLRIYFDFLYQQSRLKREEEEETLRLSRSFLSIQTELAQSEAQKGLSPYRFYQSQPLIRKALKYCLQDNLFWRHFLIRYQQRLLPVYSGQYSPHLAGIMVPSLFSKPGITLDRGGPTPSMENLLSKIRSRTFSLLAINGAEDRLVEDIISQASLHSTFHSRYPILSVIVEQYLDRLRYRPLCLSVSRPPTARFLREDLKLQPPFSSSDGTEKIFPIDSFRNSKLWFRDEIMTVKGIQASRRESRAGLPYEAHQNSSSRLKSVAGVEILQQIHMRSAIVDSFGVLTIDCFHLYRHFHFRLYLLPTVNVSEPTKPVLLEESELEQAIAEPLSSESHLQASLRRHFSEYFVSLCILEATKKAQILAHDIRRRQDIFESMAEDPEDNSEAARLSVEGHESILVDQNEQFHTLHYPSHQTFQTHMTETNAVSLIEDDRKEDDLKSILSLANSFVNEGLLQSPQVEEEEENLGNESSRRDGSDLVTPTFPFEDTNSDERRWKDFFPAHGIGKRSTAMFRVECREEKARDDSLLRSQDVKRNRESLSAIPERTEPALSSRRHVYPEETYAFFVPVDEGLPVQVKSLSSSSLRGFIASSLQCPDRDGRFLMSETEHYLLEKVILYKRSVLSSDRLDSSVTKTSAADRVNPRLQRLMPMLLSPNQSPLALTDHVHTDIRVQGSTLNIPCEGDVVIVTRQWRDKSYIQRLVNAFQQWEKDYKPLLLLRQEKAGKERQWKLFNQQKFSSHVHHLGRVLTPLSEKVFELLSSRGTAYYADYFLPQGRCEHHESYSGPAEQQPLYNHYFGNVYSIVFRFLRLLFYWFEHHKKLISPSTDYWLEVLSRSDALIPQRKVYDEQFLHQFDCRIVEYQLIAHLSPEGATSRRDSSEMVTSSVSNHPPTKRFSKKKQSVRRSKMGSRATRQTLQGGHLSMSDLLRQAEMVEEEEEDELDEESGEEEVKRVIDDSYFLFLSASMESALSGTNDETFDHLLPRDNQLLLSPIQCIAAIYQRHCTYCEESLAQCLFPHCRSLRSQWRQLLSSNHNHHTTSPSKPLVFTPDLKEDPSSQEVLQDLIKRFLASSHCLFSPEQRLDLRLDLHSKPQPLVTVSQEIWQEREADRLAILQYKENQRLLLNWRQSHQRSRWLDFLSQYLITQELSGSGFSPLDFVAARGGLLAIQFGEDYYEFIEMLTSALESASISRDPKEEEDPREKKTKSVLLLSDFILPFLQISDQRPKKSFLRRRLESSRSSAAVMSQSMRTQMTRGSNPLHYPQQTISTPNWKFTLPLQLLYDVLRVGYDFDPYPSLPVASAASPLSKEMFRQVMKLMKISQLRPDVSRHRLFNSPSLTTATRASMDSHPSKEVISFDRLLAEGVLRCGKQRQPQLVVVHLLYGIMNEEALSVSTDMSVPRAGLRFIPIDSVQPLHGNSKTGFDSCLRRGITVLVYDLQSEVSRATYLPERELKKYLDLKRAVERGQIGEAKTKTVNYREVARLLLEEGGEIFHITRLEKFFVSVRVTFPARENVDTNGSTYSQRKASLYSLPKSYPDGCLQPVLQRAHSLVTREMGGSRSLVDERGFRRMLISELVNNRSKI